MNFSLGDCVFKVVRLTRINMIQIQINLNKMDITLNLMHIPNFYYQMVSEVKMLLFL